jgi:AcrR family transcriptional regulator
MMAPKKRFGTEIRQDQIAEAALDIVRSQGLRALNLTAVAEKVGIVPSAVYRHFKNKSAIVAAVLQLIQTRLNAHFDEVAKLDIDPVKKLHMLLIKHIELISNNNAIPRIIFSEAVIGGMPEKQHQLYGIIQDVIKNVERIVTDGQQNGDIRNDLPAENIAVSFLGMIQPAAIIWNLSDGKFDLIKHSQEAWRLFSDAIEPSPRPR